MSKTILHAGCGHASLPACFEGFEEVRLDLDPSVEPDVLAPITHLGDIGPFDGVYCSHTLEHVFPHQVGMALGEFRRVLKPGGFATIIVPNLEGVEATETVLYESPDGPICGLDMIYGSSRLTANNPFMSHKCGFIGSTLEAALTRAGFNKVKVERVNFNLIASGVA